MTTILIAHGTVVSADGTSRADVLVADGRIEQVFPGGAPAGTRADRVVDATGLHVFPGFIDPHVHLGNYRDFRRDAINQTRAAATGGVTTLFTFIKPGKHRSHDTPFAEFLDEVVAELDETAFVDVGMHAGVTNEKHLEEFGDLSERGLTSFKFWMGYRGDAQALKRGSVALDDGQVFTGYQTIAELGRPAIAMTHAENEDVNKALLRQLLERTSSPTMTEWFRTRPDFAEAEVTWTACALAVGAGCPLYVVHVSSAAALESIKHHRKTSTTPLWAELTTHHLLLNEEHGNCLDVEAAAKMTPPLRPQRDLDLLWEAVKDGTASTVGSDTCPVDPSDKQDVLTAEPGFSAIDIFPALMLTEGPPRGVSLERIVDLCSTNTAKIFDVYPQKGAIAAGSDADIALIDLDSPWTYHQEQVESDSKPSPYEGWQLTARTVMTLVHGEVVYEDGVLAGPARGRALVKRTASQN